MMEHAFQTPSSSGQETPPNVFKRPEAPDQPDRERLVEAFRTAKLEKLDKIDRDLEAKIEELSEKLRETNAAIEGDPESVALAVDLVEYKQQIASALWIQAELREALKRRQNEAKGEAPSPFGSN